MDKGHACFFLQLYGAVMCFVVGTGNKLHLRAQALGVLYLHNRCAVRHADDAFDAHAGCSKCYALRVVAGRTGDDAFLAFLLGELADLIISAAHLKAAGGLQVLGLQVELAVLGQLGRFDEVGLACNVLQHEGGMVYFVESQHLFILSFVPSVMV